MKRARANASQTTQTLNPKPKTLKFHNIETLRRISGVGIHLFRAPPWACQKHEKKNCKICWAKTALLERFRGVKPRFRYKSLFRLVHGPRRWCFLSFSCGSKHYRTVRASSSLFSRLFWAALGLPGPPWTSLGLPRSIRGARIFMFLHFSVFLFLLLFLFIFRFLSVGCTICFLLQFRYDLL